MRDLVGHEHPCGDQHQHADHHGLGGRRTHIAELFQVSTVVSVRFKCPE
jgi:hypothetical protein